MGGFVEIGDGGNGGNIGDGMKILGHDDIVGEAKGTTWLTISGSSLIYLQCRRRPASGKVNNRLRT